MRGVWGQDEFSFEGSGYTAREVSVNPKPAHIPIWIGGNSALTRRRVAEHGDGWNPFPAPRELAATARTQPLETLDDLAPMIDHLRRHAEAAGRDPGSDRHHVHHASARAGRRRVPGRRASRRAGADGGDRRDVELGDHPR